MPAVKKCYSKNSALLHSVQKRFVFHGLILLIKKLILFSILTHVYFQFFLIFFGDKKIVLSFISILFSFVFNYRQLLSLLLPCLWNPIFRILIMHTYIYIYISSYKHGPEAFLKLLLTAFFVNMIKRRVFYLTRSSTSTYVVTQALLSMLFLDFKPSKVPYMIQKRSCSLSTNVNYFMAR